MRRILLGLVSCSFISSAYSIENACSEYILKPVQGKDFNFYYQKASSLKIAPKDEFETTNQYQERVSKTFNSLNIPTEFFVEIPIERKFITFDADKRLLTFSPYIIDNANVNYGSKFKNLAFNNFYTNYEYDIQISRLVKDTGSYIAKNAFGTQFKVKEQEVTYRSIFDEPKRNYESYSLPLAVFNIDENQITIDKVKALKSNAKAYALISLKPPYAVRTVSPPEEVTITGRTASTVINEALFADIKCFIITDEKNQGIISSVVNTKLGDKFFKEEELKLKRPR